MSRRTPFAGRTRSRRVTRRKYPEEWAWWAASGWQMMVEEGEAGALRLNSYKALRGATVWGGSATAEQASTKQGISRFLVETLYYHLHPRKARKAFEATGAVCSESELVAFIRQRRRNVQQLVPSSALILT
ncbi:hypothetical protein BEN47_06155 [Hymenobacter lapidarius]|uniref:Uncharacterized protein n=1 Tax=Hymenobacter lapidarius TaxID=1908237 RepID=A0A1G1SQE6_9BACT|nr:hypothetical protein [Hymenobacter lapidarius]OGX80837.1 hypothetical protein BEN47_06155 [Hymenobacter lapidarius]